MPVRLRLWSRHGGKATKNEAREVSDRSAEAASIARTPEPRTRATLGRDLRALGVEAGMALLVHSAPSRIGWTVGGVESAIQALMDVLTPDGTLMMPSFSGQLTDPAGWIDPPVPVEWVETLRAEMPVFDPARTPTRGMGRMVEAFRTWPGVGRSSHPMQSLAAWGHHAGDLVGSHALDWPLGDDSPMGRFYELDGRVLLIGVGHDRNSSLHFAETHARHRRTVKRTVPVARGGKVGWVEILDVADDHGRLFPALGAAFEATGQVRIGPLGSADARLMSQRALVDFAVRWLDEALAPAG